MDEKEKTEKIIKEINKQTKAIEKKKGCSPFILCVLLIIFSLLYTASFGPAVYIHYTIGLPGWSQGLIDTLYYPHWYAMKKSELYFNYVSFWIKMSGNEFTDYESYKNSDI
jgi:hypothetical protein